VPSRKSRSIYSVYLTESEEQAVRAIAEENACSVNFVMRSAVRKLLGYPGPTLTMPAPTSSAHRTN
jgi:hypothetical protein